MFSILNLILIGAALALAAPFNFDTRSRERKRECKSDGLWCLRYSACEAEDIIRHFRDSVINFDDAMDALGRTTVVPSTVAPSSKAFSTTLLVVLTTLRSTPTVTTPLTTTILSTVTTHVT